MASGEATAQKAILEIINFNAESYNAAKSKFSNNSGENSAVLSQASGRLNGSSKSGGSNKSRIEDGTIQVQYNPSSIKYRGNTSYDSTPPKAEIKANGKSNTVTTVTSSSGIDMSFTLVFHSEYDGDQSVREQMELIMNMISISRTKELRFSWANMQAEGRLVSFSGKYDMFDTSGNPISGRMDITIRLPISTKEVEKNVDKIGQTRNDRQATNKNG